LKDAGQISGCTVSSTAPATVSSTAPAHSYWTGTILAR